MLAGFKFGDFLQNRQFAKLKTSPKFPAIRYWEKSLFCEGTEGSALDVHIVVDKSLFSVFS